MLFISSYSLSQQVWLMAFDNSDALYIWGVLYYCLSLTVTKLQHTHLIVEVSIRYIYAKSDTEVLFLITVKNVNYVKLIFLPRYNQLMSCP